MTWRHYWPGRLDDDVYKTPVWVPPRIQGGYTVDVTAVAVQRVSEHAAAPSPSSSCSCRCKLKGAVPRQSAGLCTRRVVAAAAAAIVTCNALRVQSDANNRVNIISRARYRPGQRSSGFFVNIIIIFRSSPLLLRSVHSTACYRRRFQSYTRRDIFFVAAPPTVFL